MFVILMLLAHNLFSKKYNINYINMSADNQVHFRFKTPTEENDGIDNRHSNITQQKQQLQQDALELLAQNLEKIRLLKTLENEDVSTMTKLLQIDYHKRNDTNSTISTNLHQGDLFGDWNFEGF